MNQLKLASEDWRFRATVLFFLTAIAYLLVLKAPQTINPDGYFILPSYDKYSDLWSYLKGLVELKAYDLQPVRDLSLFLDWKLWKVTGFNSFVWQNVLWWVAICYLIVGLLKELFPSFSWAKALSFGCVYAVYPLFSGSVSWGIARKHILALFFTVLATRALVRFARSGVGRQLLLMCLWYFLGILSQPIGILFPIWALVFLFLLYPERLRPALKGLIPLFILFLASAWANFLYYSKSELFTYVFSSKTKDALNFELKFSALGHYLYQLFVPFQPSFPYGNDWNVSIAGFVLFAGLVAFYFWRRLPWRPLFVWTNFLLMPLSIILNTPRLRMDPYLLIPSFGFLVIVCLILEKSSLRWGKPLLLIMLLGYAADTMYETRAWTSTIRFDQRNFSRSPSCITAIRLARSHFDENLTMPDEAHNFLKSHSCFIAESPYARLEHELFISQVIYFDQGLDPNEKLQELEKMGSDFFYPRLIRAAILVRMGKLDLANELLDEIYKENQHLKLSTPKDPIISTVIVPHCRKQEHKGCLELFGGVLATREAPYL